MSGLRYLGRPPESDNALAIRQSIDSRRTSVSMNSQEVTDAINARAATLATKAYVDQQDSSGVLLSYVDQQDALYTDNSSIGQIGGPIALDSSGRIPYVASVFKGAPRGARAYFKNTGWTDSGSTTTQIRTLGAFSIPDPGYKYYPIFQGTFECLTTGSDARPDVQVRRDSATSSVVYAEGSGYNGDTYSRLPVSLAPTFSASGTAISGTSPNFYVTARRGYGSGSIAVYGNTGAWLSILLLPVI